MSIWKLTWSGSSRCALPCHPPSSRLCSPRPLPCSLRELQPEAPSIPQKREELFLLQEALRRKRERLQAESPEEEKGLQELAEEIEVLAANIDYINDSIGDCQATIVQLEETKVPLGLGSEAGGAPGRWGSPGDAGSLPPPTPGPGGVGLHGHLGGYQLLLPGRGAPPAGQLPQGFH